MKKRIVFLGTPDFAVPSLEALVAVGEYEIVAVVSQPDRAKDRKGRLLPTPVRACAEKLGLPLFQFERLKKEGVAPLRELNPDLMITAAYGQLLSQEILDIAPVLNVHASLLPAYRGAAPVQWAIIQGEQISGVSIMQTELGLDTGAVMHSKSVEIGESETYGELLTRLSVIGAEELIVALRAYFGGEATFVPQDDEKSSYFPLLNKADAAIDFSLPARQIFNLVRGTNPWPCAYALYQDQPFKVWRAELCEGSGTPAQILRADEKGGLIVACGEGALRLTEVQLPGGKRMKDTDLLRGRKIVQGDLRSAR